MKFDGVGIVPTKIIIVVYTILKHRYKIGT